MDFAKLISGIKIDPRPYQKTIVEKAVAYFESGTDAVLIESPTGSGKTVMGLLTAKAMSEKYGVKVGFCAMRRNLLTQTARENLERGFGLDITFISMFDKDPPTDIDFLIVDEAHHDATASMSTIYGKIKPKYILGLSATPVRSDKAGLAFGKTINDASVSELIAGGYLSKFNHYTIESYTPQTVAKIFIEKRSEFGKTLFFFYRETECNELKTILSENDITSEVVTGSSDRESQLEKFEKGEVDVLIAMMVLTEGFDCPSLKTVFVRPSIESCTKQMAGRVLRLHPGCTEKNIVQCQNTPYPYTRAVEPARKYLQIDETIVEVRKAIDVLPIIRMMAVTQSKAKIDTQAIDFCRRSVKRQKWAPAPEEQPTNEQEEEESAA